jgi:hypothetical protein
MITREQLVEGIIFAGERAVAAGYYCKDWDHQLGHQWTTGDAFRHIAVTAGGAKGLYSLLDAGVLSGVPSSRAAESNARGITRMQDASKDEVLQAIREGHRASAEFVATLDPEDLAKVVTLGGYEMPKAEIVAQIWIHHAIAHAYEASARWPL